MKSLGFAIVVIIVIAIMYFLRLMVMKNGSNDIPFIVTISGIVLVAIALIFIECKDTFKAKANFYQSGIQIEKKKSP